MALPAGRSPYGAEGGGWDPYPQKVAGPRRTRSWPGVLALVLVILLMGAAGAEAVWIQRLQDRLAAADQREATAQAADKQRIDALERRAGDLEKELGASFNSAEIAAAALPSVFRVEAGGVFGTAFAVGRQPASGTNLVTNYHVVRALYEGGGREVSLQRRDERYSAVIVKVEPDKDVALLESQEKFNPLATATEDLRSGEPIVVVGAPLGLEDSVTTGVVSGFRRLPEAPGDVIQFDAAINPGNSGGPVINSKKQVVGIATLKAQEAEGIGLAVPIDVACQALAIC